MGLRSAAGKTAAFAPPDLIIAYSGSSRGLYGGDVDFGDRFACTASEGSNEVVVVGPVLAQGACRWQVRIPRLQVHPFTHGSAFAAW